METFPLIANGHQKSRYLKRLPAFLFRQEQTKGLLDLGFLVHHMLANNGVIFLDLHLVRHGALVLVSGVVVPGTCT